jgi:HlyD family secretion protein
LGERVPAKIPVVSLLAPGDIKVVFFIPEPQLSLIKLDQQILIGCDHCATKIAAKVTFISPKAEFTPPVIYSEQSRSKLVYRIEARFAPEDQTKLHPGQPVDIFLNGQK